MIKSPIEQALEHVKLPFKGKPHDYQVEDVNRACLADFFGFFLDLGLGKTLCAILTAVYKIISEQFDQCYVLVPASLITQWVDVLTIMGMDVVAYQGTPQVRAAIDLKIDFVVMSFNIYQNDYDRLKGTKAYYIVDEATNLCNDQNLIFKMLMGGRVKKELPLEEGKIKPEFEVTTYNKQMVGATLLTATPINKPTDAFGLIKILVPDAYRNYSQFSRIHIEEKNEWGAASKYDNLDLLQTNLLLNATLRHTTDHIDLPPIVFKTVKYELAPPHMKLYKKLLLEKVIAIEGKKVIDAIQANSLYHWSQRLILRPDLAGYTGVVAGIDLLDILLPSVKNYLVFANYTASNEFIQGRYKIGACYGGVSAKQKAQYIEDFKAGKITGMTCHAKSGGVGLDFPMCQNEFHIELPVTPRDFYQCVGRIHRQGQLERTVITIAYAVKTIQETLFKRIMDKDDLMKEVIETPKSLRRDLFQDVIEVNEAKSKDQLIAELRGE